MTEQITWRTPGRTKLRTWRIDKGLSLDDVADLTGVSKSMLSRAERDQRGLSAMTKVKIARRLDVPIRDLFEVEQIRDEDLSA